MPRQKAVVAAEVIVIKGEHVTFKLKEKIRENDKLYILKSVVNEEL